MKQILAVLAIISLTACATSQSKVSAEPIDSSSPLELSLVGTNVARIVFDNKDYVGEWKSIQCSFDTCPEQYRLLSKSHRAHARGRSAELSAADGSQLQCEWLSYQAENKGVCRTPEGTLVEIKGVN